MADSSKAEETTCFEFICCGPGDPGLLTVNGLNALRKCRAVLAPALFEVSFAELLKGKEVASPFQMDHAMMVGWVEERLSDGPVALLVPGDFSTFCPFQSFVQVFDGRCRIHPGVCAHSAAASIFKKTFDQPGMAHAVVVTSPRAFAKGGERVDLAAYAKPGHTLIIYMNDLPLGRLVSVLKRGGYPETTHIGICERISCPDEVITLATLDTVERAFGDRDPFGVGSSSSEPTLALVVVGDVLAHDETPDWWDRRYEKIWKPRNVR